MSDAQHERKTWEPMRLADVGSIQDVVLMSGGGKVSAVVGDPGDTSFKQPPLSGTPE